MDEPNPAGALGALGSVDTPTPRGGVMSAIRSIAGGGGLSGLIAQLQTAVSLSKELAQNLASVKQGGGLSVGGPGTPILGNFAKGTFSTAPAGGAGGMKMSGMMRLGVVAGTMLPAYQSAVSGAIDRSYGIGTGALAQGVSYQAEQGRFLGLYAGAGFGLTGPQATSAARTTQMMGFGGQASTNYLNLAGASALLNPYANPQALAQGMMTPSSYYMNRMFGTTPINRDGSPNLGMLRQIITGTGPGAMNADSLRQRVGAQRAAQLISQEFNNKTRNRDLLVARFGGNEAAANSLIAMAQGYAKTGTMALNGKTAAQIMSGDYAGSNISKQQATQKALGATAQNDMMQAFNTQLAAETDAMKAATGALKDLPGPVRTVIASMVGLTAAMSPLLSVLGAASFLRLLKKIKVLEEASTAATAAKTATTVTAADATAAGAAARFSKLSKVGKVGVAGAALTAAEALHNTVSYGRTHDYSATHKWNWTDPASYGHMFWDPTRNLGVGTGKAIVSTVKGARDIANGLVDAVGLGWLHGGDNLSGQPTTGNPFEDRSGGETYKELIALSKGGPHSIVTATTTGNHVTNSFHYTGNAVDFADKAGSYNSPGLLAIDRFWAKNYGKRLSELIYSGPGAITVKDGKTVAQSFWGSATNAMHHNHVHVAATSRGLGTRGGGVAGVPASNQDPSTGGGGVPSATGQPGVAGTGAVGSGVGMGLGIGGLSSADISSRVLGGLMGGFGDSGGGMTATASAATVSGGGGGTNDAGGVSGTGRSYSGGQLKFAQIEALARSAGFGALSHTMAAIAEAESSGHPHDLNNNPSTGDLSYGLWQINMLGSMGPGRRKEFGIKDNSALFDPNVNAHAAMKIYHSQGLNAWSTYKSGAYKSYLNMHAKGAWELANDEVAKVHKGEMIIPARDAERVRQMAMGGGGSGHHCPPISIDLDIHVVKATDAEAERLASMVVRKVKEKMTLDTIGGR